MKKLFFCAFFMVCGCAPLFPGLEVASTALTLGNIGQTIVRLTSSGPGQLAVGELPPQYSGNRERLVREAWEQNYQLAKTVFWEGEDLPWKDIVATAARKAGDSGALFALVERRPLRTDSRREEVTLYRTVSGRLLPDQRHASGENFYPQLHARNVSVPIYTYIGWYFAKSRQPSGILAMDSPRDGPCAVPGQTGSLIRAVGKNSPAQKANLRSNDVIAAVNGRAAPYDTLFLLLKPGVNTLAICRDGNRFAVSLPLPSPGRGAGS